MSLYVFLGTVSEAPGLKLTRFGERVELSPELAQSAREHGGLPCIPAEEFDAIFSGEGDAALLKKYAVTATHAKAPAEFLEKKAKAIAVLESMRGGE